MYQPERHESAGRQRDEVPASLAEAIDELTQRVINDQPVDWKIDGAKSTVPRTARIGGFKLFVMAFPSPGLVAQSR